ncbi:PAS domain S-box protein [Clostridium beijerinckii]|uniref:histidine kinase n=2 Tax=Clostridium beijerinckii TaxID=1520 RepID=A0AAW3WBS5_CLOBE|nr:PAS domain S-box protein [Clostridium beijerinckii]MBC2458562.1 PAS domain S-box protein [Clostridium beijerinckii]MBC2475949.1 PAS domain S-box protein [Clostridium beijerinckii]MDG5855096.1 PAS domain S-box protein [Clostridium beijerinckii]NOV61045.1 PAS domain S-box-containing protein [Clostridium beijerinckii]NOW33092.1 PAS domain S-box-containing protein [Clostridium beijerinckii]
MKEEKLSKYKKSPIFLVIENGLIVDVSAQFIELTEYRYEELLNSSIINVFEKLRVGPNINTSDIDEKINYFLFTKSLGVKFVNIKVICEKEKDIYIFSEKMNSNIEIKHSFLNELILNNYYGVGVYSLPDMTLLKTNEKYVSFMDEPFNKIENCIGKHISEFTTGFKRSAYERLWDNLLRTKRACNIDEYQYDGFSRGITYWRISLIPIFEDGEIKYCVAMLTETTEQVVHRKKIEEQAEIIKQQNYTLKRQADMLNLSREAIFAWKLNGSITCWNKGAELMYGYTSDEAVGCISHDLLKTVRSVDINTIKESILEDGVWSGEIEHTKKDGKKLIIETSHQIFVDEYGQLVVLETNRDITERKKLEEEIRHQKAELDDIIQSIDDALVIYDSNKNCYLTNKSAEEYFKGTNLRRISNPNHFKFHDLNGDEIPKEKMTISKVFKGEVVINDIMTLKNATTTKHISLNGRPIYDSNGNIKFAVLCCHDITHDIEAQMLIEQQNKKLEAIISSASDGMFLFNPDNSVTLLNKESEKFIYDINGYKSIGDTCKDTKYYDKDGNLLEVNDLPGIKLKNSESIKNFIITAKGPDKTIHYSVSACPIYDDRKNLITKLISTHDITERFNNERKILEQKEQLQAILDNMQDSVYVFNKDGEIFLKNKMAQKRMSHIGDYNHPNDTNKKFLDLDGSEIIAEDIPHCKIIHGEYVKEYFMKIKIGECEQYVSVSGTPVFDKEGNFAYGIINSRDITDFMENQKALEKIQIKLLEAEREKNETLEKALEMKDEFLSLISHEFRTPLNVINSAIQAIDYFCSEELSDRLKKYLRMIRLNSFRQLRLVNNILDITRANAGRIKVNKSNIDIIFMTKAIVDSVYTYASQKSIDIIFSSSVKQKIVGIDDEKYERILLNLLSNAIKFTPEGKSISVKILSRRDGICIKVKDKGIGIPQEKADIIFERFGQVDSSLSRQAEGTGIGLSLVKKFVEAIGGTISLKSKVGRGSAFSIFLPSESIVQEKGESEVVEFSGNRLIQTTHVEFSDIYS